MLAGWGRNVSSERRVRESMKHLLTEAVRERGGGRGSMMGG